MTSTKIQINYNIQKFNDQNSFGHPPAQASLVRRAGLVIDIWILFVICFLLFGAYLRECLTLETNTK